MSSTNPAHVVTRIFPPFLFLLLFSSIAFAHREDYIDETLVFATLDRGEVESQYWFDVGSEDSRKDKRGVDLISDALPFGRLWYDEPDAINNAIDYAKFYSRSHGCFGTVVLTSGHRLILQP